VKAMIERSSEATPPRDSPLPSSPVAERLTSVH
jgi:hypothetical protein